MSGICAGIEGKVNIYDVVISSMCHQHDSGKWTSEGFIPELYTVPLLHQTQVDINLLIQEDSFKNDIKNKEFDFMIDMCYLTKGITDSEWNWDQVEELVN